MKRIVSILLFAVVLNLPLLLNAQIGDPGDDPDVPIDGGLSILLAVGAGYVVKKGYDARKKVYPSKKENASLK